MAFLLPYAFGTAMFSGATGMNPFSMLNAFTSPFGITLGDQEQGGGLNQFTMTIGLVLVIVILLKTR